MSAYSWEWIKLAPSSTMYPWQISAGRHRHPPCPGQGSPPTSRPPSLCRRWNEISLTLILVHVRTKAAMLCGEIVFRLMLKDYAYKHLELQILCCIDNSIMWKTAKIFNFWNTLQDCASNMNCSNIEVINLKFNVCIARQSMLITSRILQCVENNDMTSSTME